MAQKSVCKGLGVLFLGLSLMGNQKSCEKKPEVEGPRQLRKTVDIERIESRPVNLGEGGSFDFDFVVNQQIYAILLETNAFSFRREMPVLGPKTEFEQARPGRDHQKISAESMAFNVPQEDIPLLREFLAEKNNRPQKVITESREAWCMANLPQVTLTGAVNSFEILGKGGINIGFGPSGGHQTGGGLIDLQAEFFQLDLSMQSWAPLTGRSLAAANVTSKQTKTKIGLGINLGSFSLGPSFYYSLPLATVTKKALTKAVEELSAKLQGEPWYTRVIATYDVGALIVGGLDLNLREGDELGVYNEVYSWEGVPCRSRLRYDGIAKDPVAVGVLERVSNEVSLLKFTSQQDDSIELGAKVKLLRKVEDIKTPSN